MKFSKSFFSCLSTYIVKFIIRRNIPVQYMAINVPEAHSLIVEYFVSSMTAINPVTKNKIPNIPKIFGFNLKYLTHRTALIHASIFEPVSDEITSPFNMANVGPHLIIFVHILNRISLIIP